MTPLLALDRLNGWARCSAMKESALAEFSRRGALFTCLVHVDLRCNRRCGGKGRYMHESGDLAPDCWGCNSTGTARLVFAESTIHVDLTSSPHPVILDHPLVWHSPRSGSMFGANAYHNAWAMAGGQSPSTAPAGDWTPRRPGLVLDVAEAAELLCVAEAHWRPAQDVGDWDDCWDRDTRPYHLDLGPAFGVGIDGQACVDCGAPATHRAHVESVARRLTWSAPICSAHSTGDHGLFDRLRDLGPPPAQLADARIQRWLATHPPEALVPVNRFGV